jgi:xylulokinase
LPQDVPETTIGASYGDAFLVGLATGLVPGLDALREWVKPASTFRPRATERAVYDAYYPVYRGLYESSKDQLHALARLGSRQPDSRSGSSSRV